MYAGKIDLLRSALFAAGMLLAVSGCSGRAREPLTLSVVHINDVRSTTRFNGNIVRAGLNYHFDN